MSLLPKDAVRPDTNAARGIARELRKAASRPMISVEMARQMMMGAAVALEADAALIDLMWSALQSEEAGET